MSIRSRRSIQTKVILSTVLAFIFMLAILYVIIFSGMMRLALNRENEYMRSQGMLAESILMASLNALPAATRDWAAWNLTHDYILGRDDALLREHLTDYPFHIFQLNLAAMLDARCGLVYERFFDYRNGMEFSRVPDFSPVYAALGPLIVSGFNDRPGGGAGAGDIGRNGLVSHPGGIFYISSYPVTRNNEAGPCAGVFLFGRMIDQEEVNALADQSGLDFGVFVLEELDLSESERAELLETGFLLKSDRDAVFSYIGVPDILGNPGLALRVISPRNTFHAERRLIETILGITGLCCLGVLLFIIVILRVIVSGPLVRLARDVDGININTFSSRLEFRKKNRELDTLTLAINDMLARIQDDRQLIRTRNESLFRIAYFDGLTGLWNRSSIKQHLEFQIKKAAEQMGSLTVFFLDLDHFKNINDCFGHALGDHFIVAAARGIKKTAGKKANIARMGSDEFLVVIEELETETRKTFWADRIMDLFKKPFHVKKWRVLLSVSVGSSSFPEDGQNADTLIRNAEIAMYKAKELGRNRYVPYRMDFHLELRNRIALENKMRHAIIGDNCGEFCVYLQPKYTIGAGAVKSCEALLRWASPGGMVAPGEFIPQAEKSGLIVPLTWWLIEECCALAAEFCREGHPCCISVNIPAQVLVRDDFPGRLKKTAGGAGIGMEMLDIEITESSLLNGVDKVNRVLKILQDEGTTISVDDFGTGYSSLSYLNELAVDRIKIDRSFVTRIGEDVGGRALIKTIIAMGKSLRMIVTAEGVEDQEQYNFLKKHGCHEIQGYLVSRPLPAAEFPGFMGRWNKAGGLLF